MTKIFNKNTTRPFLSVSVSLNTWLYLSVSVSISTNYMPLPLCMFLSVSVLIYFFLSLCLCLLVSLSLSVSVNISIYLYLSFMVTYRPKLLHKNLMKCISKIANKYSLGWPNLDCTKKYIFLHMHIQEIILSKKIFLKIIISRKF